MQVTNLQSNNALYIELIELCIEHMHKLQTMNARWQLQSLEQMNFLVIHLVFFLNSCFINLFKVPILDWNYSLNVPDRIRWCFLLKIKFWLLNSRERMQVFFVYLILLCDFGYCIEMGNGSSLYNVYGDC